jgi:hypothetical protein
MSHKDHKHDQEDLSRLLKDLRKFMDDRPARTELHEKEHEFLRKMMEEYEARVSFWEAVQKKVATTGILATISAILSAVGYAIVQFIKGH